MILQRLGKNFSLSRALTNDEKVADLDTLNLRDQLIVRMKEALPKKETGEINV